MTDRLFHLRPPFLFPLFTLFLTSQRNCRSAKTEFNYHTPFNFLQFLTMDVEQVMQFLRANGLSAVEFALKEDIKDNSTPLLDSCDLVTFRFPVNPPLPPVRLLSSRSRARKDSLGSDSSEDDDEFVSLNSSTTEVCSSDFTNPYGCHSATQADSDASSSDRLSQFGTAREYHEFNMQTDLWYDHKEDGHHLTPYVVGGPSEDKYVMTSDISNLADHPFSFNLRLSDEENDINSQFSIRDSCYDVKFDKENHYFYLDEKGRLEFDEINLEGHVLSEPEKHKQDVVSDQSLEGWTNPSQISTEKNLKLAFQWNGDRYDGSDEKELVEAYEEVTTDVDEQEGTTPKELPFLATAGDIYEVFDLRIIHRRNRTGFEENRELPILLNSTLAGRYYVTEYLGSAAFSKVVQAHDIQTGLDVCLKIIKNDKDFFDQSLDEIKLLKYVNKHDPGDEHHILRLYDYFYHQEHLFIVCELLKANLYEFQKYSLEMDSEPYFTMDRLQAVTRQSLEALDFLHGLGIIHCDLKPENILIKSYSKCEIKVIDLGSSCFLTDNLSLYVQSRSYRAPEVILGLSYGPKIDIWSFGCILAELCSGEVLFPNDEVVMLLARVISLLGPINVEMLLRGQETHKYFTKEYNLYYINEATNEPEYIVPEKSSLDFHLGVSDSGFLNFVEYLLQVNPKKRPTAKEALQHPWLLHRY